jgi:hypothetical protein
MSDPAIQIRNSSVTTDETWSGEILITKAISVDKGVTLTINPGTIIKFQNYRGYQQPHLFTSFEVTGTIKALGNFSDPIWFTSDGIPPINGDWGGITLTNSTGSIFNYTIVEYGILGIALFNSDTVIANSIVRWVNTEGYYAMLNILNRFLLTIHSMGVVTMKSRLSSLIMLQSKRIFSRMGLKLFTQRIQMLLSKETILPTIRVK